MGWDGSLAQTLLLFLLFEICKLDCTSMTGRLGVGGMVGQATVSKSVFFLLFIFHGNEHLQPHPATCCFAAL